ncbi:MAG: UDP-N-acetylmuramoyl-L-alanine--D-glutamate ligase [Candidatus Aminicenantia bacterium]
MDLKNKKVLVVGIKETGNAVCEYLLKKGAKIMISEVKRNVEIPERIKSSAILIELGEHRLETFEKAELIVVSPGVSMELEPLKKAKEKGIKVISEIELAFMELKGLIIGITGSNGKSTTTTLTHKIISASGRRAFLSGNIGIPLITFVENSTNDDVYVVELSSFQLEGIEKFRPKISSILNITPDHLDRYHDFSDYVEAKRRILMNQKESDFAVLNLDDETTFQISKTSKAEIYFFSRKKEVERGSFVKNGKILFRDGKEMEIMEVEGISLMGVHNLENILASVAISILTGVETSIIRKSVMEFKGLEHRMEHVGRIGNVVFYNDSKATNVDATLKSIQSFEKGIVLIMGGRDKGGNFDTLREDIRKRVKGIVVIGEAKEKIKNSLKGLTEIKEADSIESAVITAFEMASPSGIVLLAPACASFDMFENFEQRGRVFKSEVLKLVKYHEKN